MTSSPQPLPSLPPSPVEAPKTLRHDEDVGRAWHDDEPSTSDSNTRSKTARKGRKRRGRDDQEEEDEDEEEEDEESGKAVKGYPPTKEEQAESRRIEENLRRWEVAERQRRKTARESASYAPSSTAASNSPSLFADLFRRDSRKVPLGGVGAHHALSTHDRDTESVPLEDLDTPSLDHFSAPPTPEPETENPFETPSASRTSLNIAVNSAIMTESDSVPDDLPKGGVKQSSDPFKRPTLEASSSFAGPDAPVKRTMSKRPPPPPKPLGLPAPREPPPHPDAPRVDRPPEPVMEPDVHERDADVEAQAHTQRGRHAEEDHPPVRWWHEWLCGCGEGADRGGDHQAGRTNPFE